jgi:hypothetical protein
MHIRYRIGLLCLRATIKLFYHSRVDPFNSAILRHRSLSNYRESERTSIKNALYSVAYPLLEDGEPELRSDCSFIDVNPHKELVGASVRLRRAQVDYMANRGNDRYGISVKDAADHMDSLLLKHYNIKVSKNG